MNSSKKTIKAKEWFAVKRTKKSSYQFYEPNKSNKHTIESIAPNDGNYEVITLIERAHYNVLFVQAMELAVAATYAKHALACAKTGPQDKTISRIEMAERSLKKALVAFDKTIKGKIDEMES